MEFKKMIVPLVVVIILAAVVVGVVVSQNNNNTPTEKTVVDARGRTVVLKDTPETILPINCCSLELLSYFDSAKKIVAVDKDDAITNDKTYTQVLKDKMSSLEKVDRTNVESIIVLSPDVIITSTVDVGELDKLQSDTGIPVFAINADLEFGDEKWFDQIKSIGTLLNESKRANEIVDGMKEIISELQKSSVKNINGYTCGMMFYGQGTFLKTSGDWLPFIYSGVNNVMPPSTAGVGKQPYDTTIEVVQSKVIDYIFIDNSRANAVLAEMEGYVENTGLMNNAIANGDIYNVSLYKKWGTQFDAVLVNCIYVAKLVNPNGYSWSFEDMADKALGLLYGDKMDYATMVQLGNGCGKLSL